MADAQKKVTIFFEAPGKSAPVGWTETWWSSKTTFKSALAEADSYVAVRKDLLGYGAAVQAARISNPTRDRQTVITFYAEKDGISNIYGASGVDDFDPTQVDLLIRLDGSNGITTVRRNFFLAGIPDSQTRTLLAQGVFGGYIQQAAFKKWANFLMTQPYYIRKEIKPRTNPRTYDALQITAITPIMVRNRKRGRPFFLFRGRRLA